jgi:hypothetical protein
VNLLFCTGLIDSERAWRERYRPWADHHRRRLDPDAIFIIDDGGAYVPSDHDVDIVAKPPDAPARERIHVLRFPERLGRRGQFDFPGWWRSFEAGIELADRYGATRLIHVESDARVLSDRLARALNRAAKGWVALWCPSYRVPEPSIQVIHRDSLGAAVTFAAGRPDLDMAGRGPELLLPFTSVERRLIGDRYAEFGRPVPDGADYACQIFGGGRA